MNQDRSWVWTEFEVICYTKARTQRAINEVKEVLGMLQNGQQKQQEQQEQQEETKEEEEMDWNGFIDFGVTLLKNAGQVKNYGLIKNLVYRQKPGHFIYYSFDGAPGCRVLLKVDPRRRLIPLYRESAHYKSSPYYEKYYLEYRIRKISDEYVEKHYSENLKNKPKTY